MTHNFLAIYSWAIVSVDKILSSFHKSALDFEGKNSHKGYVHKGVVAGGSDEVKLGVHSQ